MNLAESRQRLLPQVVLAILSLAGATAALPTRLPANDKPLAKLIAWGP